MLVLFSLFLSAAEPSGALAPKNMQPSAQPSALPNAQAIQVDAAAVLWKDAPPTMPRGTQMAVLEGDPSKEGMFTIRLRAPKGFQLMLHTHPAHERVTVLEGSISVGFDLGLDKKSARTFKAGAFYVNPPGVPHFVYSDEGGVVQITGSGPWKVEMAQTVPSAPKK